MTTMKPDKREDYRLANDFAFKWFEVHADQRLKMMNFFLIIAGFCFAGYFTSLELKLTIASIVIAGILSVVSFCFKQLDRRTCQLLELGEDHLKVSLSKLSSNLEMPTIDILNLAEKKNGVWSYRKTFNILYWVFGLMGLAGIVFASYAK